MVGAGSGSDVAIALSKGAERVDAVDIDPRIVEIGVERNPDQAYQDPRVTRHINDGRAFLEGTDEKYDLILFALPDSLSLVSGASQIRLESFLFTEEALRSAHEHLTDDGVFAMYNYYREDWLIDRLGGTVAAAFGHDAVHRPVRRGHRCRVRGEGAGQPALRTGEPRPARVVRRAGARRRAVPLLRGRHGADDLPVGAGRHPADVAGRGADLRRPLPRDAAVRRPVLHGCGVPPAGDQEHRHLRDALRHDLDRERHGVRRCARDRAGRCGDDAKVPDPAPADGVRRWSPVSLAVAYVVRPEWLLELGFGPRLVAAVLLAFVPIYLANIAFAKRFAASGDSQSAFGVNLLGAIVGGCLEYAALLTGYRNLLVLVALLYLAAFLLKPKDALTV